MNRWQNLLVEACTLFLSARDKEVAFLSADNLSNAKKEELIADFLIDEVIAEEKMREALSHLT